MQNPRQDASTWPMHLVIVVVEDAAEHRKVMMAFLLTHKQAGGREDLLDPEQLLHHWRRVGSEPCSSTPCSSARQDAAAVST